MRQPRAASQSRQGLTPDTLKAELARLDSILVALLFVFAFFLGSTVARNSDVWQHLATGRLISGGQYSFGSDPFSYTSAGRAWINHSWLADLLAYKLWESLGGIDSVLARAGLVAAESAHYHADGRVHARGRRRGQSLWLPVCCVALALYAMSPRMYLQPAVISQLFLAITLFLAPPVAGSCGRICYRRGTWQPTSGKPWRLFGGLAHLVCAVGKPGRMVSSRTPDGRALPGWRSGAVVRFPRGLQGTASAKRSGSAGPSGPLRAWPRASSALTRSEASRCPLTFGRPSGRETSRGTNGFSNISIPDWGENISRTRA